MTLRIPVPASARAQALRVFDHFERITRRAPGPALRNPPRTYRICAFPVPAAAAAGGVGYAVVRSLPPEAGRLLLPGLAIGACVLAIFGGDIALATYLSAPLR